MSDYPGFKAEYSHDYDWTGPTWTHPTRPRYLAMFAEDLDTPVNTVATDNPFLQLVGEATAGGQDGYFRAGVYASGSWPGVVSNGELKVELGKITADPGIVLNPTTEATAPDTLGSMMYDSGTDELKYYDGSWQVVAAGGLSAHTLATTGVHTGALPLIDIASYVQGSIIIGGGSDWEALGAGTETHVLTMGASEPAWAAPASGHSETHTLATTGPHTDTLPWADMAAGTRGGIVRRGATDWEEYALGTETYVLKAGATDVAWGTVDWSELTGSQPAPVSHDFDVHTGDVDLVDIASYAQGSLIIGGGADWEALTKGDADQVLTSDGTDLSWQDPTGGVTGSGTQYDLTMWSDAGGTAIGDSMISQDSGGTTTTITSASDGRVLLTSGGHSYIDIIAPVNDKLAYVLVGATDTNNNATMVASYNAGTQVLDKILFRTKTSGTGTDGRLEFEADSNLVLTLNPDTTADFVGDVTFGEDTHIADSLYHYMGTEDDVHFRFNGSAWQINAGAYPIHVFTGDVFQIKDPDDGNATVWALDTTARTLAIGTASDQIATTIEGTLSVNAATTIDSTLDIGNQGAGGDPQIYSNHGTLQRLGITGELLTSGIITINTINAATSDLDKFLVSDSGEIKFRTGAEVLSDIGAAATGEAHALATSGPHTGELPWADMAAGTQGGIVRRGASDWEEYAIGTEDYVLKAGASDVAWGQVDYSELVGTQPAPVAHVLATSGPHSGTLPLADLAVGTQGGIIRRGASDWEEYALGTETYVLKAGATDVAWGTVDWSELTGSQPAPISHALSSHTQGDNKIFMTKGSTFTEIALGTDTYLLTSGGDGADLTWTDPSTIGGGGGVTGSGTNNQIVKWLSQGVTIQDSIIADDGSTATVAGALTATGIVTGDGFMPEADLVDYAGSADLTFLGIYVQNIYDDDGTLCAATQSDGSLLIKELNTDSSACIVYASASALLREGSGAAGVKEDSSGKVTYTGGDDVGYFEFSNIIPQRFADGTLYLQNVIAYLHFTTSTSTDWIDDFWVRRTLLTDGTSSEVFADSTNKGFVSGDDTYNETVNLSIATGYSYRVALDIRSSTGTVTIRGFKFTFSYV